MILGYSERVRPARSAGPVAVTAILGLLAAACGEETDDPAASTDAPTIVATTSIWADVASNVACGEPVATIIPPGADPHSYEPSLRDRELVSGAGVVVANGAGLEATTADLLDAAIGDGVNVVEMANHIDLLDGEHADEDGHDDEETDDAADDGHGHSDGEGDPHVWQDPTRIAGALDVIASALAPLGIETCEEAYREELLALDAEITATLGPVPASQRLLVTSHDSLAYFADRYDFEIVGTVIPSTSTMADSSAGQLAELADLVERRSVRAIFTDTFESARDAEALANRLDIPVVPLVTDAVTDGVSTYDDLMRSNATKIADALVP